MAFKANTGAFENYVAGHARLVVVTALGILVLAAVAALLVFFFAIRGAEQAMVPDLRDKELVSALQELQAKELYPRIQTRYSESSNDRGFILEQDPMPGTIVKAGRRIKLIVSQGMVVNNIEDYRGRNIGEVRMDLQALFASTSMSLLTIKEPFMYEYSSEEAGTILQQKPEPGEPVSGPVTLEFVVSRGPAHTMTATPNLWGLSPAEAVGRLGEAGLGFRFSLREARGSEDYGTVVFQEPARDAAIESGRPVTVLVTSPAGPLETGEVFALFSHTIPENPYPLSVRLELLPPGANSRELLVRTDFGGGSFTFPYKAVPGAVLIFSMEGRELHRETVMPPMDELSLDEI
ncbi:MAG: PASTA domain-containing protein [Spirochaetaceae bacterium]|jgi:beta-lactam-binding protein with PASTA domain|nr:PASTA domain-containing protein [Spirochaetaceae bacterium]